MPIWNISIQKTQIGLQLKRMNKKRVGVIEANPILVDRFPIQNKQIFMLLARHHSICSDQLIKSMHALVMISYVIKWHMEDEANEWVFVTKILIPLKSSFKMESLILWKLNCWFVRMHVRFNQKWYIETWCQNRFLILIQSSPFGIGCAQF